MVQGTQDSEISLGLGVIRKLHLEVSSEAIRLNCKGRIFFGARDLEVRGPVVRHEGKKV